MNRTPPRDVLRRLRSEVGFGCPVSSCGNPYLYWHHFDPPWREREHHDPNGMIAICAEHHAKADAGSFTKEQLRDFKRQAAARAQAIGGKFDWMRRDLLAIVGGNFYYRVRNVLVVRDQPCIWFNRDEDGYFLLNLQMLTTSGEARTVIQDNFWTSSGQLVDLQCPPSGRLLRVEYANGDMLRVEFSEVPSADALAQRYQLVSTGIVFPLTTVEVQGTIAGTDIRFGPKATMMPGNTLLTNNLFMDCETAVSLA